MTVSPEAIAAVAGLVAIASAISGWVILPRRVDALEKRQEQIEQRVASESATLTEVKTTLDLVRERVDAIADKLNVN